MSPFSATPFKGFFVSAIATIAAWQTQLDFWLRILATLVAITAGLVSIYVALRKKPEQK